MTAKAKTFDCVAMKNRIQAELAEERSRLGDEEFRRRREQWLKTTTDPLARWWRSLTGTSPEGSKSA